MHCSRNPTRVVASACTRILSIRRFPEIEVIANEAGVRGDLVVQGARGKVGVLGQPVAAAGAFGTGVEGDRADERARDAGSPSFGGGEKSWR